MLLNLCYSWPVFVSQIIRHANAAALVQVMSQRSSYVAFGNVLILINQQQQHHTRYLARSCISCWVHVDAKRRPLHE